VALLRPGFFAALVGSVACSVPGGAEIAGIDGAVSPSEIDAGGPADATASADATPVEVAAPDAYPGPCTASAIESWQGTARRRQDDGYPDSITATITWTRTSTVDCVDTYAPSGTASYGYAIPGALCSQWITPESHAVAASEGWLTVDRSTWPPTYAGHGATFWTIVHHCQYDDGGLEESDQPGGAIWFDSSGTITGDAFGGSLGIGHDDPEAGERCGPHGIPPCEYIWQFTAN
jgi:hypothetical protein